MAIFHCVIIAPCLPHAEWTPSALSLTAAIAATILRGSSAAFRFRPRSDFGPDVRFRGRSPREAVRFATAGREESAARFPSGIAHFGTAARGRSGKFLADREIWDPKKEDSANTRVGAKPSCYGPGCDSLQLHQEKLVKIWERARVIHL